VLRVNLALSVRSIRADCSVKCKLSCLRYWESNLRNPRRAM
jgi:hypothetical protein